jgi:hypothetical protein
MKKRHIFEKRLLIYYPGDGYDRIVSGFAFAYAGAAYFHDEGQYLSFFPISACSKTL